MGIQRHLLLLAAASLAASVWGASGRVVAQSQSAAKPASTPAPVAATGGGYLGSEACESCHTDAYARWKASLHIQMTRPLAAANVAGDFSPRAAFSAHGRAYSFGRRNGTPFITVRTNGRSETYDVAYTLGSKRLQGYLATLPGGRLYVLPVFWHVESRRWVDWKETTPIPDGAHDLKQIWNVNCFNCHATNLDRGYQAASAEYRSTWTELGIGCEACHGPGRDHVALMKTWEADPASIPTYSSRPSNRGLSELLKIFSPRSAEPRRSYDTCAYCHGNKRNVFTTFAAGDRYEDHALPYLVSEPAPAFDPQGEFWPDGRPSRFNRTQALTLTGCFKAGAATCTSCHLAHGPVNNSFSLKVDITKGRNGDTLCTQCHLGPADAVAPGEPQSPLARVTSRSADEAGGAAPWSDAEIARHSFHPADSEGSRCINCHMSDVNWRLLLRRRDHTFQSPVPETTAAYGVPNACTTCHDDKTPEWAARQMDDWWGDGARRQQSVALAKTLHAAGAGDASALPALAALAVDRSRGSVLRASALEFIGQLVSGRTEAGGIERQTSTDGRAAAPSPAAATAAMPGPLAPRVLGALLGAASDPEAIVRAAAVRTLGMLALADDARVQAVLMARVVDEARVVRVRAAESLLALGVTSAPGRAGQALLVAQQELIDSLRSFPDSASEQALLAWVHAERGEDDAAVRAADAAARVDPTLARPYVVRGVIAARNGRFAEALAQWKAAKERDPATPNIDRLIDEATRRLASPGR